MTFLEYGNASAPTILMIHGMGMTAEGSFGYAKALTCLPEAEKHAEYEHCGGHHEAKRWV